jgi:serine/threonine-protein kinase RsbW
MRETEQLVSPTVQLAFILIERNCRRRACHSVYLGKLETKLLRSDFVLAMNKRKIEFTSHTANLALMRDFVRRFLDAYPFSEKQRTLMVLGIDEACTNVIRYAYAMRDDQTIRLSIEGLHGCVRMRLRDYGEPIYKSLNALGSNHPKSGGRGIQLMRHIFDRVDYFYKPRGTELVLTKNLE